MLERIKCVQTALPEGKDSLNALVHANKSKLQVTCGKGPNIVHVRVKLKYNSCKKKQSRS